MQICSKRRMFKPNKACLFVQAKNRINTNKKEQKPKPKPKQLKEKQNKIKTTPTHVKINYKQRVRLASFVFVVGLLSLRSYYCKLLS